MTSSATNRGIRGATVNFALGDKSVGSAVTDDSGIATLKDITISYTAGTHTRVVLAAFAGDTSHAPSEAKGDLRVNEQRVG